MTDAPWAIGDRLSALCAAGLDPIEVRVSPEVKQSLDTAVADLDVTHLRDVPVVVVEGAEPDYWAVRFALPGEGG